jgi:hypothetical protein
MQHKAGVGIAREVWFQLGGVLAFALAVRLGAHAASGGILHWDEIFQYQEPAHRLVFGDGVVTWEWRSGVRSWLFPGVLAGVMEAGRLIGDGPVVQNAAVAVFLALLSLPAVACCYLWGRQAAGAAGGLAAAVLVAGWSEVVLMSIHPLLDGVGTACLVPGAFLLQAGAARGSRGACLRAGLLLGLTVALRLQLAPAVAWVFLRVGGPRLRVCGIPAASGIAAVLLLSGLLDWVTLGAPFQSITRYVWANSMGAANYFGVSPWYTYILVLPWTTGVLLPVLGVCIWFGSRRLPLLAEIAVVILASLSCVQHKEFRFLFPAFPFLLTLAGVGSGQLAEMACARMGRVGGAGLPVALTGFWAVMGVVHLALADTTVLWANGVRVVQEMDRVSADPDACGLAIVPPEKWYLSGGYSHLRPGIRLVGYDAARPGPASGFNYAISLVAVDLAPHGMTRIECLAPRWPDQATPGICLWRNPVGCAGPPATALTAPDPPFMALVR